MAVEPIHPAPLSPHMPPHNNEAEQSVLGAMLVNPNAIAVVVEASPPTTSTATSHRSIYRAILALYDRGEEVDVVTLSAQLEREGALDQGRRPRLRPHAGRVRPGGGQRRLLRRDRARAERAARRSSGSATRSPSSATSTPATSPRCSTAASRRSSPSSSSAARRSSSPSREVLVRNFEHLDMLQREQGVTGVASRLRGHRPARRAASSAANLIVLAARPGVGKTSLALNMAQHIAVEGKAPVAVFSLEMSAQELGERMMCSAARVSSHKVRTGTLSGDDYAKLVQAAGELEKADDLHRRLGRPQHVRAARQGAPPREQGAARRCSSSTTCSSWWATAAPRTASRRSPTSRAR